jgi:isopenicillin-N epimerase
VTSHGASATRTDRSRFHLEFDWTGTTDPTPILCVPRALDFLDSQHPGGILGLAKEHKALVVRARELLASRVGLAIACPESMLGSMASLRLPDDASGPAEDLHDRLYDLHRIQVPVMPWPVPNGRTIRVSAHQYNRMEHYDALATALISELNRI